MEINKRRTLAERFWPKVDRRSDDECWLWQGAQTGMPNATHKYGYLGRTPASPKGPEVPAIRAHVASYVLHFGPVPSGHVVCHRCDVPLCVNPNHLFAGTLGENNRDRSSKGRDGDRRGLRNPNVILTPQAVAEIRARYAAGGVTQIALAAEYGVVQPHISRIVRGINYT